MIQLYVAFHAAAVHWAAKRDTEAGQATAEYALVLLGAAAVALLLMAWATKTGKVGKLFNTVVDSVIDKVA